MLEVNETDAGEPVRKVTAPWRIVRVARLEFGTAVETRWHAVCDALALRCRVAVQSDGATVVVSELDGSGSRRAAVAATRAAIREAVERLALDICEAR